MRIKTGCRRKIHKQETALFVSASREMENDHIFLRKLQRSRARGKKEKLKHQRAPLSPLRMLFMLLTGLLTSPSSFCGVSLGAHFEFVACGVSIQLVSSQAVALFMSAAAVVLTPLLRLLVPHHGTKIMRGQ